jgi:hypothetical protein
MPYGPVYELLMLVFKMVNLTMELYTGDGESGLDRFPRWDGDLVFDRNHFVFRILFRLRGSQFDRRLDVHVARNDARQASVHFYPDANLDNINYNCTVTADTATPWGDAALPLKMCWGDQSSLHLTLSDSSILQLKLLAKCTIEPKIQY